jgi:hypothetical protein
VVSELKQYSDCYCAHAWAELIVDALDKRPYLDDGTDTLFTLGITSLIESILKHLDGQRGIAIACLHLDYD